MIRTTRQLERCELARRLFIRRAETCPIIEARTATVDSPGGPCRAPACLEPLDAAATGWFQIADLGDRQVIGLVGVAEVPASVRAEPGVVVRRPDELDFDLLIPPFADRAAGHLSYAHTRLHVSDEFAADHDPLGDDPDWTALSDGAYVEADGGEVVCKPPGAESREPVHRNEPADMSGVAADYSVESHVTAAVVAGKHRTPAVTLRMTDADNFYRVAVVAVGSVFRMHKRVAGEWTLLGSQSVGSLTGTIRLEAVGSTLKGYFQGNELISTSDTDLTSAGYAGIYFWIAADSTGNARLDDFRVWVERRPMPAALDGPLAARSQQPFALAR